MASSGRKTEPRGAGRAQSTLSLDAPVTAARYVNESRAKALKKLKIRTVGDLLTCYPRRYLDMSSVVSIGNAPIGETVTVVGVLDSVELKRTPRKRVQFVEAALVDDTGVLVATWFAQPWVAKKLARGQRVALSGKVTFGYGFKRMSSPFSDVLSGPDEGGPEGSELGSIIPVHRATEGLSASWMRRLVSSALRDFDGSLDPLPAALRDARDLMGKGAALRAVHFPATLEQRDEARRRLAYEEVLELQLHLLMRRSEEVAGAQPTAHRVDGPALAALRRQLPFTLSDEQDAAVDAILADMARPACMNRLLEGDVGTGKTVVAAHALAAAADTGAQAAMMAPTGVLAAQYRDKLGPLLDACGVSWALLTGATPARERGQILEALAAGEVSVLFGTHALLEPDVVFKRLTLVVIDEQQRFGVEQRATLLGKGEGVDLLTMTATPIPRTLALALYGDLEVSYLRKRPRPGAGVSTKVLPKSKRDEAYEAVRAAVADGQQAYIVCPLVGVPERRKRASSPDGFEEADALRADVLDGVDVSDAKAAENLAAALSRTTFKDLSVGLLTGRMKPADKERVMGEFSAGRIDVLVSTTVIEVGIDVPRATVMLVEDAELFGLSQLHQLRGRVGRGDVSGTVYLLSDPKNEEAAARMDALASTDDGIELAELDLASRREGDVLGFRQHGASTLKLVDVTRDRELIERAHRDARSMLAYDPTLSECDMAPLRREVERVFRSVDDDAVKGG